jgi:hypothetical protein
MPGPEQSGGGPLCSTGPAVPYIHGAQHVFLEWARKVDRLTCPAVGDTLRRPSRVLGTLGPKEVDALGGRVTVSQF